MKDLFFTFLIRIRRALYSACYLFDRFVMRKKTSVFVLCYHSIEKTWRYSVSPAMFKRQMLHLSKNYQFLSLTEFAEFLLNKRKLTKPSVLITFDDGYKNVLTIADFLQEKRIYPAMFLLSDTRNANRGEIGTHFEFLDAADLKKLFAKGWSFGSHSATHADFQKLSNEQMFHEIAQTKKELSALLATDIIAFAYPKGRYTQEIVQEVKKAGFRFGFTMDDNALSPDTDPLRIPRIGVDNTHSFWEFTTLYSPSVIAFRRLMKGVLKLWL